MVDKMKSCKKEKNPPKKQQHKTSILSFFFFFHLSHKLIYQNLIPKTNRNKYKITNTRHVYIWQWITLCQQTRYTIVNCTPDCPCITCNRMLFCTDCFPQNTYRMNRFSHKNHPQDWTDQILKKKKKTMKECKLSWYERMRQNFCWYVQKSRIHTDNIRRIKCDMTSTSYLYVVIHDMTWNLPLLCCNIFQILFILVQIQ